MKVYGKTRSAVLPDAVEITESKVFVASDIEQVTVTVDDVETTEYEFNLVEYEKDEYIQKISDKNDSLEQELTNTQIALTEVYEMLG